MLARRLLAPGGLNAAIALACLALGCRDAATSDPLASVVDEGAPPRDYHDAGTMERTRAEEETFDAAADDAGPDAGAAASDTEPGAPPSIRALYAMHRDTTEAIRSLRANVGFRTVYSIDVAVEAGDLLRIAGQVEMTNDYVNPVRGQLRIVAGEAPVGPTAQCNGIVSVNHHMPLWTDGVVQVTEAGVLQIRAEYRASRSDASPTVTIENGYGNLIVEQYRSFASPAAAAEGGARLLAEVAQDTTEAASSFGWERFARTRMFDIALTTGPRDLVRLHAQTTSRYGGNGNEQHGHGIFRGSTKIGPWSTENTPWEVQTVPLSSGAVDEPGEGTHAYQVSMHGVAERGAYVVRGAGHLSALRFAPTSVDGMELASVTSAAKVDDLSFLRANAAEQTVASTALSAAEGDLIRTTGMVTLVYPAGFSLGVSCYARVELRGENDAVLARGPMTTKYITYLMSTLPLRAELIASAPRTGAVRAVVRARCVREGASPGLTVASSGTALLVDHFRPLAPP